MMKITHLNEIKEKNEVIQELQMQKKELEEEVQSLEMEVEAERRKREEI